MGRDMLALMRRFGFEQFELAGHDRGGRCAYRLALDHPDSVEKLAVLDIIPTGEAFRRADMRFGLGYWHWFFLAQPFDLPERLISANPDNYYFRRPELFAPEALEDYLRCVRDPATIHAMCEDYRAAATLDFSLDEADRHAGRKLDCPVLALWARQGQLEAWYDVLAIWRDWATDVRGRALDCGHYLPEEAPEQTAAELRAFFAHG
jgi:haloacetate dehalogenase